MKRLNLRIQIYGSWFIVNFVLCLLPLGLALIMKNNNTQGIFLSFISYAYTLIIGGYYLYDSSKKANKNSLLKYLTWITILLLITFYCIYPSAIVLNISNYISSNVLQISIVLLILVFIMYLFLNINELENRVDYDYNESQMKKSNQVTKSYEQTLEEVRDGI